MCVYVEYTFLWFPFVENFSLFTFLSRFFLSSSHQSTLSLLVYVTLTFMVFKRHPPVGGGGGKGGWTGGVGSQSSLKYVTVT